MIYKFRIIVDTEEDIFRDIEIEDTSSFEQFHDIIHQSFGFKSNEMASFYMSNDLWEQGEEIILFSMGEDGIEERIMRETLLKDMIHREEDRLIYVYDFLNLWTFYVTLMKIGNKEPRKNYPNVLTAHGTITEPETETDFEDFEDEIISEFIGWANNDMDIQNYSDFNFNENWN